MVEVVDEAIGTVIMPGPCIRFAATPIVFAAGAPRLGADGAAIRREIGCA
jgi:crotonobetainyl-CoA:carnitine CoA-transferase CaiB-like acyl-CoA transferase